MIVMCLSCLFLKPFLKGRILQTRKGGKLDFEHHFAFLTNFLKTETFLLSGIFFSSSRGSFSKKNLSKADLPFIFCLFVCFVATLSDFGLLFLNSSTHRAEKDANKGNKNMRRFGVAHEI